MKSKTDLRPASIEARSHVTDLLVAAGLRPDHASTLADLLLWNDTAGLDRCGIASLPDLLDRIGTGEVDPKAEAKVGPERAALCILDGRRGPPLLVLARAAEIASEKAREYGSGLVRVRGIGPIGTAASAVFAIAIGPAAGMAAGPSGAWSVALPSAEGLPLLADSALGSDPSAFAGFSPWSALIDTGEWLIQAVSVPAMEPLGSFHARVAEAANAEAATILLPSRLEDLRREARERGVLVSGETEAALKAWAARLGV